LIHSAAVGSGFAVGGRFVAETLLMETIDSRTATIIIMVETSVEK
jgi:hypothetical protein